MYNLTVLFQQSQIAILFWKINCHELNLLVWSQTLWESKTPSRRNNWYWYSLIQLRHRRHSNDFKNIRTRLPICIYSKREDSDIPTWFDLKTIRLWIHRWIQKSKQSHSATTVLLSVSSVCRYFHKLTSQEKRFTYLTISDLYSAIKYLERHFLTSRNHKKIQHDDDP